MNDDELIDLVWDNLNDEISAFRNEIRGWSPKEKDDNAEKIRFYEGMVKYLARANIFTDEYKALYRHGKSVLKDLWAFSRENDYDGCGEEFVYEEFFLSGKATAIQGELC